MGTTTGPNPPTMGQWEAIGLGLCFLAAAVMFIAVVCGSMALGCGLSELKGPRRVAKNATVFFACALVMLVPFWSMVPCGHPCLLGRHLLDLLRCLLQRVR